MVPVLWPPVSRPRQAPDYPQGAIAGPLLVNCSRERSQLHSEGRQGFFGVPDPKQRCDGSTRLLGAFNGRFKYSHEHSWCAVDFSVSTDSPLSFIPPLSAMVPPPSSACATGSAPASPSRTANSPPSPQCRPSPIASWSSMAIRSLPTSSSDPEFLLLPPLQPATTHVNRAGRGLPPNTLIRDEMRPLT